MSTHEQLKAMQAEIESHVENLRQLRKQAVLDDVADETVDRYTEAIKFGTWMAADVSAISVEEDTVVLDEGWPEPDGYRIDGDGLFIPTTR